MLPMPSDVSAPVPRSPALSLAALIGFLALTWVAGWLGTFATTPAIPTWYAGLEKPWFNPPNSAFPIAWGILYTLMAVAAWLVWRSDRPGRRQALVVFLVQLVLNVLWSFAFFGAHSPLLGLIVIAALIVAIVWTIRAFAPVSRWAAWLMAPYLAWVLFATLLNASILWLNGA
jgi:tryptophan-rich sensory protein